MRRDKELPLCNTEPVSVTPKRDPSLAKALPTSDAGDMSVTTHVRKGKDHCTAAVRERAEREYVREIALQTPRLLVKEEDQVLQAVEQRFLCSPWCTLWLSSCVPSACGGPWWSRGSSAACEGPVKDADAPEESCNPV